MAILFKDGCFKLDTKNTTYSFKVAKFGYILHGYYGKTVSDIDLGYTYPDLPRSYVASVPEDTSMLFRINDAPQEYSAYGIADFRTTALRIKHFDGSRAADLRYFSHEIIDGVVAVKGLPHATQNGFSDIETLKVVLKDSATDVFVNMYYTVFEQTDVIARFVEIENKGDNSVFVEKAASLQLDFNDSDYDFITLTGAWAKERHVGRRPLVMGTQGYSVHTGTTSHQYSTFFALCDKNADENMGGAYGFHLVYSGNHKTEIEVDQFGSARVLAGINDEGFSWEVKSGDKFVTPEAFMTYSNNGLGQMSRNLHEFIIRHIFREKWHNVRRPLLINNWEATYFDFNYEKLVSLAETAGKLGIELLVMDDGWFGKREDDKTSLGDWIANTEKLPGGLERLAKGVNEKGVKFGIWMEPEMISEDSDLYRAHPDWAISIPGRAKSIGRNQYVLDITRDEVKQYVIDAISNVIGGANIEYLKWDMNRYLTEAYSSSLGKDNQGEFYHRYVLAVYDILDVIINKFPNLLIEHCSGGGGRFDTGMLYYSPQIWTSDDTDAHERIEVQRGTSMGFPVTCMGSHVSAVPNHQTGRVTPLNTRGVVAYSGTFGYELDITALTDEEREEISKQCEFYKENYWLINCGDYYRLNYVPGEFSAWCFASKDKKEILIFGVQLQAGANDANRFIKIPAAEKSMRYVDDSTNQTYFGDTLNNIGLCMPYQFGERTSFICHLRAIEE